MVRIRLARSAIALAFAATALTPLGGQARPPCPDDARRTGRDGWTLLARPAYTLGEDKTHAWAASPFVDGFLLATNKTTIARSIDGGCSWEEVYSPGGAVGEFRLTNPADRLYDVALPPSPPGRLPYTAYGVISDLDGTRVVTSSDLGETWIAQPSAGLPALAQIHAVKVAADPRTAYVLADFRSTLTRVVETALYVTKDAGLTFQPVQRGLQPQQYTNLELDPSDPRQLWAWDATKLFHSTDSGTTFRHVTQVPGPLGAVDVQHYPAYAPARIVAYRADRATATSRATAAPPGDRRPRPARSPAPRTCTTSTSSPPRATAASTCARRRTSPAWSTCRRRG